MERFLRRSFQLPACAFSLPFDSSPLLFRFPMSLPLFSQLSRKSRHADPSLSPLLYIAMSEFLPLKDLSHESHHVPRSQSCGVDTEKPSRHLLLNLRVLRGASGALGILHLGQYFHVAVRPAKTSGAERFPKSYSAWWLNSSACRWRWRWVLPKFRGLKLRSSIEPVASSTLGHEVKSLRDEIP